MCPIPSCLCFGWVDISARYNVSPFRIWVVNEPSAVISFHVCYAYSGLRVTIKVLADPTIVPSGSTATNCPCGKMLR